MSRNIARALVPEQGPEAAAIVNLNSEETRDVREKAIPKAGGLKNDLLSWLWQFEMSENLEVLQSCRFIFKIYDKWW